MDHQQSQNSSLLHNLASSSVGGINAITDEVATRTRAEGATNTGIRRWRSPVSFELVIRCLAGRPNANSTQPSAERVARNLQRCALTTRSGRDIAVANFAS